MNFRLNRSGKEVTLLTILQFRGTIDIHKRFGSTGGTISPLNAEGNERVVLVRIDLVSLVTASSDTFGGNSSISSLLLFRLGCCLRNFCHLRMLRSILIFDFGI